MKSVIEAGGTNGAVIISVELKLHEDLGTTPAAINTCLSVADEYDVQVAIHTDTLNEAGFVEDTIAAYDKGIHRRLGLQKKAALVKDCRKITKKDMIHLEVVKLPIRYKTI